MNLRKVVLMQGDTSTILLGNNGHASSTKQTKHIDIQYFYVKEKMDSKDFIVEYCQTEHIRADFFTKPLHGNLFKWLGSEIMGFDPSSPYFSDHRSVLRDEKQYNTPEHDRSVEGGDTEYRLLSQSYQTPIVNFFKTR